MSKKESRIQQLDAFRTLMRRCPVLDFQEQMASQQLFERLAEALALQTGCAASTVLHGILEHEEPTPIVIGNGCALPHTRMPGKSIFGLALARVSGGVIYSSPTPPVHAVVADVASHDLVDFHCLLLCQVARAVDRPEFLPLWLEAEGPDELRDLFIRWSEQE